MRFILRTTIVTTTLAAGLSLGTAFAQDHNVQGWEPWATESARAVSDGDREQVISSIVEKWTGTAEARNYRVDAWRSQVEAALQRLDNDRLALAAQAGTYAAMVEAATGKNPDSRLTMEPQTLGQNSDDLSFTAITPCRIMDTRFGIGVFAGPRAAGSTTNISTSIVASIQNQGGRLGGCPELPADAGALAYTLTVVDYTGNAYVLVYPYTAVAPNASTINMGPGTSPSPVANSSVVLQCYACGDELSVYVAGASTNVIIDAIGYYNPAPSTTVTANRTTVLALDSTCQNYTSTSLFNPSTRTRTVVCNAVVTPSVSHTVGTHDEIGVNIATAATTCGAYNTVGVGYIDINQAVPTGCCWNQSTATQGTFSLAAGTTGTYYLNVLRSLGASGSLVAGQIRCTLVN